MKTYKLGWIGILTFLVLILLVYRYSKPGKISVYFNCDEQTKTAFELALKKLKVDYKQSDSEKSSLIVFDDQLIYHGQIFRFYWDEELEKKIVDVVSSHIKAVGDLQSNLHRFEQLIRVPVDDQREILYTARPQADSFDEIVYKIIKDVLKGYEGIFENGYLVVPLVIEVDGKKLMVYDSKDDQVYMLLESGGS